MTSAHSSIHGPGLPAHEAALVTAEEQGDSRNLICVPGSPQGVQLPNLAIRASRPGHLEHRRRHARLDQPRTDGVDANICARQLERNRLSNRDDGRFGSRVWCAAGVGAQSSRRGREDNAPCWLWLLSRGLLHRGRRILGSQEGPVKNVRAGWSMLYEP
jgi:hypothetical protein